MPDERELLRYADAQFGLITAGQAGALGFSAHFLKNRVRSGRLERVRPRVYRVQGSPRSWQQDVMSVCLWAGPGAVVSHRTAGVLWALDGIRSPKIEITLVRRLQSTQPDVRLHHTNILRRADRAKAGPIPLTSVERTLIDLGAVCPATRVEIALDNAVARGLTSLRRVQQSVEELATSGRRGIAVMRGILQPRLEAGGTPTTGGETKLFRGLIEAGLPLPKMQYWVRDAGRKVAQVDFAYPERRLAIEFESWTYHSGKRRWEYDLDRRNDLTEVNWRVIWARNKDLEHPADLVRRILAEYNRAA